MTRLAVVQMPSAPLDPETNIRQVLSWIHKAAAQDTQVVVFPECVLTGYVLNAEEAEMVCEPIPGPLTERLGEACRQTDITIVVGTLEMGQQERIFNTSVMIGPQGVVGRYRKTHLPLLGVDRYLTPGDAFPAPFETPVGRLSMLICYDLRFPEPARVLALAGAQAILLPTAWPQAATLYPEFVARARAAENRLFVMAANRAGSERGTEFLGRSMIVGPEGEVLAEADGNEEIMLLADVDLARSDEKRRIFIPGEYELDVFGDRRPDLYRPLASEPPHAQTG